MNQPDFSHRAFDGTADKSKDFDDMNLIDCVGLSVERAEAIILQMQTQFIANVGHVNDASNFSTLEAIKNEILDIKSVVDWFVRNKVSKQTGVEQ